MKQHFVPRCYLNEFASTEGSFYTLDFKLFEQGRKPQIRLKTPTQIAYEIDLYTLDIPLPAGYSELKKDNPYVIEQEIFWRYEREYPAILKKIRNRVSLSREEAELFIYALVSMKLRNKFILNPEHQKDLLKKVIAEGKDEMIANSMELFPHLTIEEKLEAIRVVEEQIVNNDAFVKGVNLMAMIERETNRRTLITDIATKLINCEWKILESDYSALFVTTDNPGFCIDSQEAIFNTKFADCTFVFPLTPMLCLVIDDKKHDYLYQLDPREKKLHYQLRNQDAVSAINDCSTRICNRYIVSQTRQTLNSLLAFLSVRKAS